MYSVELPPPPPHLQGWSESIRRNDSSGGFSPVFFMCARETGSLSLSGFRSLETITNMNAARAYYRGMRGKYFSCGFSPSWFCHSLRWNTSHIVDEQEDNKERKGSILNIPWMWWWWWRPGLHIRSIFISREFIYTFSFISNLRNNLCYYWNCWKRMQNERWNNSERYFSVFSFIWRPFKHTHIRIRCAIKYHQICHLSARILRAYETKTILRKKKNKEKITLIHELVSNMCHLLHTQTLWSHRLHLRNTCIMLRWHSPCCANADTHRTEAKWKKRKRKTTNGKYQWKWVRKKKRKRGNLRNENALTSHILQLTLSVSQTAVARKTFSLLSFNDDVGSFHLHGVYFILQTSNSYKDISICGRPRNAKCWRYIASCDFNASVCVMFGFQAMTIKTRTNGEREKKKCANMLCKSGDSLSCTLG